MLISIIIIDLLVQENELLQPDKPEVEPNVELLTQLLSMGFDLDRSKHALLSTGNSGTNNLPSSGDEMLSQENFPTCADLNTAMEYILANPSIESTCLMYIRRSFPLSHADAVLCR